MKKILTLLFTGMALSSFAQTPLMDNFNYTNDSLAAVGTNNGWIIASGTTVNAIRSNGTGLTYTGYVGSGVGNSASLTNNGQDVVKDAKVSYTSGSVYASFLLNVTAAQAAGDYFFGLVPQTSLTAFTARTFIKLSSIGYYRVGIMKGSTTLETTTYSNDSFALSSTYLCVVKYTFNTGTTTDDSLKVYMLSSGIPATEPTTPTVATIGGTNTDATTLGRVLLRQGTAANAPTLTLDAIRFSPSWANGPLDVTYNSFEGTLFNNQVNLTWSTASETNNKGFDVERSLNGVDFETIGFVAGNGTSSKVRNYQFITENKGSEISYFRLKQLDFDGQFEYSKIISIKNEEISIEITPNPFADEITINASAPSQVINAEVIDITGKIKMSESNEGSVNIDTRNLAQGIYFIRINHGETVLVKRIIKN
ncbi:MAG: hypothetical protein CFE21_01965 [Bacteroidetes bacterium B1(2017)]|nr:MAG: hypothetical protein CFE21_01965 [Bacteroidetes bacterium B1(2017)]